MNAQKEPMAARELISGGSPEQIEARFPKLNDSPNCWGKTPGGRFCNVFKFRDGRISSLHIYLDPDYTGEDEARFRRGRTVNGESDDHPLGGFSIRLAKQRNVGNLDMLLFQFAKARKSS